MDDADIFKRVIKEEATRLFGFELSSSGGSNNIPLKSKSTEKCEFRIEDFIYFSSEEEFLTKAYQIILGRPPDPDGFSHYLKCLRKGRYKREEVLFALRYSPEGKSKKVKIRGLLTAAVFAKLSSLPILGVIFRALRVLCFFSPEVLRGIICEERALVERRLNDEEDSILSIKSELKNIASIYKSRIESFSDDIEQLNREAKANSLAVSGLEAEIKLLHEQVRRYAEMIKIITESSMVKISNEVFKKNSDIHLENENFQFFYASFENRFRGSRVLTRGSLSLYVPYILEAQPSESFPVVDVGSGRGEWLGLLREKNIPAIGIEINPVFVEFCRGMGMKVIEQDVFEFLADREDNSISVVTAFHFIEHLSFGMWVRFLREVYRCLKPSGLLIIETPNPRNILVGAGDFFRDPTHVRPVFPDTLEVLCESIGFQMGKSFFFDDKKETLIECQSVRFDSLEDYVKISRDFAWIGYKL